MSIGRRTRQYVMGITGGGMASFATLVLAVKFGDNVVLSAIEVVAMFALAIGIVRKNLFSLWASTGYFVFVLGIPMMFSGNPLSFVIVLVIAALQVQGLVGALEERDELAASAT